MEGFTTPETHNKWSLRASATGELVFANVKVPKENLLPNISGLKGPLGCLDSAESKQPKGPLRPLMLGKRFSLGTLTLAKTSSPVAEALNDHLLWVSGVVNPSIPRSTIRPYRGAGYGRIHHPGDP